MFYFRNKYLKGIYEFIRFIIYGIWFLIMGFFQLIGRLLRFILEVIGEILD